MRPRLGLIGRLDNRGIGYQTLNYWNGLGHPLVLAVTMDDGWPSEPDRFGFNVMHASAGLSARLGDRFVDERVCRQFLKRVDVVLGVETPYDWDFIHWADEAGVKVFIVGNPEMYAHDRAVPMRHEETYRFPHPNWCWPTTWMLDQLPPGPLLPVPCEDRPNVAAPWDDDVLRVLHVVGKQAAGDRNGTWEVIEAVKALNERVHVTFITQERKLINGFKRLRNVTVDIICGGVEDRWSMYANQHVLVLPRKYGGLCLPALEAMASGLCVIMSDQSPNETWPGPRVQSYLGRQVYTPAGRVKASECHPIDIANAIDMLAREREMLRDEMSVAREYAQANNWANLEHRYWEVLSS